MPRKCPLKHEVDIICHGYSAFDLFVESQEVLVPGQKYEVKQIQYNGGGVAANIAAALAQLGEKVGFSGFISTDSFGDIQYQNLMKAGVNLELVIREPTPSTVTVIIGQPEGHSILAGKLLDQPQPPATVTPIPELFPKLVLLDGTQMESSIAWLEFSKQHRLTTLLNGGYITDDACALAEQVDIIVCSRQFAASFCGSNSLMTMVDSFRSFCNRFIITLDDLGALWYWDGEKCRIDAWQTRCRDGVGAGDAFHGAFCSGLLNNLPLMDNLLSASAAGALCCQGWGTRERLPDWKTIQSFMQSQPKPSVHSL